MITLRKNVNLSNNYQNYLFLGDEYLQNGFKIYLDDIETSCNRIDLSRTGVGNLFCCGINVNQEGDYTLKYQDKSIAFKVRKTESKKLVYFDNSSKQDQIQNALNHGNPIVLQPGIYFWTEQLILPNDAFILGYGATIIRLTNGDWANRIFTRGNNATIIGLTLHNLGYTFHSWPETITGLTLVDCTIVGGNLGAGYADCLIQGCVFKGATCVYAPLGVYLKCKWINNDSGNAFNAFGPCAAELAMVDCEFDGTDRGPVFNTTNAAIVDNLFINTLCRNINRDNNGNEIFMVEGSNEYSRNVHIHTRVFNCDSHCFQFWSGIAKDNKIYDTVIDGGCGFWLSGVEDVEQTGNIFDNFELRRCGITLGWLDVYGRKHGYGIKGNYFRNGAIVDYQPSRGNTGYYVADIYTRTEPIHSVDPIFKDANTFTNIGVANVN